jgi:hypothetical protein
MLFFIAQTIGWILIPASPDSASGSSPDDYVLTRNAVQRQLIQGQMNQPRIRPRLNRRDQGNNHNNAGWNPA